MGNSNPELSNNVWIININNIQCQWEKITFENNSKMPCERLYHHHTCGIYPKGNCEGIIIIFGGKDSEKKTLNDIWRYDTWSFSNADAKNGYQTKQRYNHSIIIIGGRGYSNGNNNQILIEVFNTLNNEGYSLCGINMYRQTSFIYEKNIYLFGGFGVKNQKRPLGDLYQISLENLFGKNEELKKLFINNKVIYNIHNNKKYNINTKKSQFKLTQDVVNGAGGIEAEKFEDTSTYHKISLNKLA